MWTSQRLILLFRCEIRGPLICLVTQGCPQSVGGVTVRGTDRGHVWGDGRDGSPTAPDRGGGGGREGSDYRRVLPTVPADFKQGERER